jgi:hypothetical protein
MPHLGLEQRNFSHAVKLIIGPLRQERANYLSECDPPPSQKAA